MPGLVTVTLNPALDTSAVAGRVEPDRKVRCSEARRDPGGGGINVARAVDALGGRAVAVWAMGGPFGEEIRRGLEREGIANVPIEIDGETRQSFAVVEEDGTRHFRFSTPGPRLGPDVLDRIAGAVEDASPDLLVISGGHPPGTPTDFSARLAEIGARDGARVVVDTHDEPLRAVLDGGAAFLIKPNERELRAIAWADPDDPDPPLAGLAESLLGDSGIDAILVSLGAGGALLVTAGETQRIRAPDVEIRSQIGAGDSLVAGLSLRLLRGDDPAEAAAYGVAAGTAAVTTPGTELCRREDTERIFAAMGSSPAARR
jgi:6-phosphofructokinase 2